MRLVTDTFAYCRAEMPAWNTISISGYHMREAGATAVQEVAFTIANAIAYGEAALAAGLAFDEFAPRLSFFFAAHNDLFEEVAKFRAARRVWARVARERFGARDPKSMAMRFHVQTGGSTLTAQQPDVNVVRTTVQALAAILGGAQSLHTNASDEALGLPTPATARLALRTQQVLAAESGVATPVDPLGGAYYVEALTDEIEERALAEIAAIDERGGTLAALADGYQQAAIADAAYAAQRAIESGDLIVVGVNAFAEEGRRAAPAAAGDRPGGRGRSGGAHARGARGPGRCPCIRGGARARNGCGRDRERAAADPRLRGGAGHAGGDQRRAAGRMGGVPAMTIGPIDHVAVVVRSIDEALPRYRALFGWEAAEEPRIFPSQRVRLCFLPSGPEPAAKLELVEPIDDESGVARFLATHGEGLHHVCMRTDDLDGDLVALAAAEAELIDREPRPGAHGRVAFIHPRTLSGVLWELLGDAREEGA